MKKHNPIFVFIYSWLPALACMLLIFHLSSHPRFKVSDDYWHNFLVFKFLHMCEYATLYFLVFRAVYTMNGLSLKSKYITAICIAIFYAMTDEFHQTFVPTREGTPRDVIIDSVGILLAFTYTKYQLPFVKKFL